jgi:lysophospholipase L1-like esterase
VGDSNTFGHGVVAASESYPAQLQDLLGDGYEVLNFGVSSRSLLSTARWPYTAEPRYEESLRSEPDVVLVMLGTNDAKDVRWDPRRYRTELVDLVETYRALPSAPRVYLLTVPAAFANTRGVPPDRIATQVVPIIRDVAETTGAPLVDVYAATRDHGELFLDGIHPNATGFGIVAATVRDALVPR